MASLPDKTIQATRAAIGRAKRRGSQEVTSDDLLMGLLGACSRFGVVLIGDWCIDLEDFEGASEEKSSFSKNLRPAYTAEATAIFDRAALIARKEGNGKVGVLHLLAAFAPEEGGLMGRLKEEFCFTGKEWRAALARSSAQGLLGEAAPAGEGANGGPSQFKEGKALFSPDEAAQFLSVHTQTIRGYIKSGKLPAFRIAGERAIRIRKEDLLSLLDPLSPEEATESP